MKNSVNIGIIGLGGRGTSMMSVMAKMEDINILAVCDKYPDRVDNAVRILVDSGRPAPMGTVDYNEVLDTIFYFKTNFFKVENHSNRR